MEIKDLIGLALVLAALPASMVVNCFSRTAREVSFFLIAALAPVSHKLSIDFFSHYWYRGTTRGMEISVVDVLAAGLLAGAWLDARRRGIRPRWPGSLGLMALFFGYACVSVICFSEPRIYGTFELFQMLRGVLMFLAAAWFVEGPRELALLVLAIASAVWFEAAMGFRQRVLQGMFRVPGSLMDANSLSMYLCTVTPLLVAAATSTLPAWLRRFSGAAVLAAAATIFLTISRAGVPIFALVVLGTAAWCVSWRITPGKIAVAGLITLGVAGLVAKSWNQLSARYVNNPLSAEYLDPNQYESRGYFLRLGKIIVDDRFWGVGLNNWSYWVSKKYGAELNTPYEDYDDLAYTPDKSSLSSLSYAAPAHNLAALTAGELGVPGLMLFMLLWLRWFQMGAGFFRRRGPDLVRRLGIGICFCACGIFLQSITEWTFRQAQIFLTFHILIGTLASLRHLRNREEWQQEEVLEIETVPTANELVNA